MIRKVKSLHHIVIDGCSIYTKLHYNLNTNHVGIGTTHQYSKIYKKNNKNDIKKYQKDWRKNNKNDIKKYQDQYNKIYYKLHRDPNMPRIGSLDCKIKISCGQQGIPINEFCGFLTEQKYCEKWTKKLREEIRNKYNNRDYISGIHKDICNNKRQLSVHHVNYDKQCGCNGNRCKLIPLSHKNHSITNGNRQFWNRLFKYSLEYDKEYYNNNEINIWEMI